MATPITIRKERFYPHPPEDVWAAITDPHALAEWLEPNNHQAVAGHAFEFKCDAGLCGCGVTECQVLEADPPRRLVWSWVHVYKDRKAEPMTITWTLVPKDNGTLLILEHTGAENIGWLTRNLMRMGWGYMMKRLIPQVLTQVRGGKFTPGAIPLSKRYYTCKTVPEKYVR
ncbi:MAG: SRPBCC domain-containing protein [Verrucomicrobiota bacterium]